MDTIDFCLLSPSRPPISHSRNTQPRGRTNGTRLYYRIRYNVRASVLGFLASEQLNITSVLLLITVGKTEEGEEHEAEKATSQKEDSDAREEFR